MDIFLERVLQTSHYHLKGLANCLSKFISERQGKIKCSLPILKGIERNTTEIISAGLIPTLNTEKVKKPQLCSKCFVPKAKTSSSTTTEYYIKIFGNID